MVYCILKYPNIRIVYGRANDDDARAVLRAVKDVLGNNPTIVRLWGRLGDTATIWAEDQIVLARPNANLTEPTIGTTGLGRTLTGSHPDLVILDDLVTDANYRSEKTTARSRELLFSVYPVLEPWGSVVLSGTRWAANDIYGNTLATDDELYEAEGVREWTSYVRAVENDGVWFFPDVLSPEFIEQQRRSLRQQMMLFSSWYYNSPYELGTKLFPRHHIHWFEGTFYRNPGTHIEMNDGRYVPLYVTMTVDPAPTVGPDSDFTGITVVGCDANGTWYVLWAEAIKRIPSDAARHLIDLARVFYPAAISIETGMADPTLVARLQTGLKDLDVPSKIVSYSALQQEPKGLRGKGARIESLEPLFREEKVFLHQGSPFRDLLTQLDGYGALDHDDVIDALAMQRVVVRPCQFRIETDLLDRQEWQEERDSWAPETGIIVDTGPRAKVRGVRTARGSTPLRL
jgi:predicted phage terminase large subunit-like protein